MTIENGKKVKIEYEGSLDNGDIFDSSNGREPLEFIVGEGRVIPGFEEAVKTMNKGEEKTVNIKSKDAYGDKKPELIKSLPKDQFPQEIIEQVKVGMIIGMQTPEGQQVPVKISEINESEITLDLNHPLAGENLNFKIKLLDILD
jgi:FKBP-type peptidyl-prolyl cis-trans isomerase 2